MDDPLIVCFYASVFGGPFLLILAGFFYVRMRRLKARYGSLIEADVELERIKGEISSAKLVRDQIRSVNVSLHRRLDRDYEKKKEKYEAGDAMETKPKITFTRSTIDLGSEQPAEETFFSSRPTEPLPLPAPRRVEPPRQSDLIAGFHKQRFAFGIASLLGGLATFLPWMHAPIIGDIPGTAIPAGWISLGLFMPALVLACARSRRSPMLNGEKLGAAVPAGIAAVIAIANVINYNEKIGESARADPFVKAFSPFVLIGIGVYLLIAAGGAIVLMACLMDHSSGYTTRKSHREGVIQR